MNTDGLIFDLDGTLWDASAACICAWNNTLQQFGMADHRVDKKIVAAFSGRLLEDILTEHFKGIRDDQFKDFIKLYAEEEANQMREIGGSLYPGAKSVLEKLRLKFPLFIVSNCQKGYIENFLRQHQIENLFTDFESSGNTGRPKRNNIKDLVTRNKLVSPVYVGDTMGDFEACKWNGIPFIYASYGFGNVINPSFQIRALAELAHLLA